MSPEMIVIVLLAWVVTGVLAAIVFGRMVQEADSLEDDEAVPVGTNTVSYLRRREHKSANAARVRHGTAKRATS